VWGLGPELPRAIPYQIPLTWLSTLLDGALVAKAAMILVLVLAFVGAHRLAAGAPAVARVAAGLVYAAGPFLATRLAIGHLGTALATAVLPWALPTLLRPADSLRRTLLWSAALGVCGVNGGLFAGAAVLVGLVADRGRRAPGVAGVALLGQLPWLVPGVIVSWWGVDPAGAEAFGTRLAGPLGLLRLSGGQGYFIADFDVGGDRLLVPLAALAVVSAAVAGWRRLPAAWGGRALVLAAVGFGVAAASGLPLVDDLYTAVADSPVGSPLREGHRVLPLFLVWLAPASAHGWARLEERLDGASVVGLGTALVLIGSSLWGFGGQVAPVDPPSEWAEARRVVDDDPGPVLALPFTQYVRPDVIDRHLVHQPLPYVLGGDVLYASGRGVEGSPDERADGRLDLAGGAVAQLRSDEDPSAILERLGIRWIAVVRTVDVSYDGLETIPGAGLEVVVEGPELTLYRVPDAPRTPVDPVIGPLARVEGDDAVVWFRPGSPGWLRGWEAGREDRDGNLAVPAADGPLWYWPSILVLLADGMVLGGVALAWRRHR
jgi:hypothetical protein